MAVLRTSGISDVEAEELAILPSMEELSAIMYVNPYRREQRYDVIVLDCAPPAESLRFISMPTTLGWYMKHVFPFQRGVLKAVRPLANRISPVELPSENIQSLFQRLDGIGEILENPKTTSVRLVTNPEKMVLCETQRAFVYFTLHGLTVDGILVKRVLPAEVTDAYFTEWRASQGRILEEIDQYFSPVPKPVPLDPNQFQVISHSVKKTDPNDARNLALYLDKDLLPEVRMKDKTQAQLASLMQTRDTLVKLRTSLKNKINNILSAHGIHLKKEALSSEKRLNEVLAMKFDPMVKVELEVIVEEIRSLNQKVAKLEKIIADEVRKLEGHKNLTSIKGIGPLTGSILVSVMGDIHDFRR